MVPIQKSIRFFIKILPVFFALVNPASTIAKPACIQNTNAAPIRNQTPKTIPFTDSKISPLINVPPHFSFISISFGPTAYLLRIKEKGTESSDSAPLLVIHYKDNLFFRQSTKNTKENKDSVKISLIFTKLYVCIQFFTF